MGYYTVFSLGEELSFIEGKTLKEISKWMNDSDIDDLSQGMYFSVKWYNWENDMKALSRNFPDKIYIIYGDGEEIDDKWKAYIINGKMQFEKAQISYGEFDNQKLI